MKSDSERERRLDEVLTAYLEAIDRGAPPDTEELLAEHSDLAAELNAFLEANAQWGPRAGPAGPVDEEPRATTIGRYRIVREIARGGMGVVFEVHDEALGRIVALKRVLGGALARADDVERFRREVKALGRLDHRHIVPIYEVGEHGGSPYFTMKYIERGSLADRVARFENDERAAAALVEKLARAMHAAHLEGLLHRDLKPANVLIDRAGEPLITDFGLAKDLGGEADLTLSHATLGTPAYMAPEQVSASRGDVGVEADVYGLGAILYELLTGAPPFEGDYSLDLLQRVAHETPRSPASRRPVSRDLETITLRCLEKAPGRRYASAEELAAELRRFLEGRPIEARPLAALGRARRWARRNPAGMIVGAALLMATIVSTVFYLQARTDRDRAESLRRVAELRREAAASVAEYLVSPALSGGNRSVREVLGLASTRIASELRDRPAVRASMHAAIAKAYEGISEYALSAEHYRLACATYVTLGSEFEAVVSSHRRDMAFALACSGRGDAALAVLDAQLDALPASGRGRDAAAAEILEVRATVHLERGDPQAGIQAIDRAIALRRGLGADAIPRLARDLEVLADCQQHLGEFDASLETLAEAIGLWRAHPGDFSRERAWNFHTQGWAHLRLNDNASAAAAYREARRIQIESGAKNTLEAAINLTHLASIEKSEGHPATAEQMMFEALEIKRSIFGDEHVQVSNSHMSIGTHYLSSKRLDAAEEHFRLCLAMRLRFRGPSHPSVQAAHIMLADTLSAAQRAPEALEHRQRALSINLELYGWDDERTQWVVREIERYHDGFDAQGWCRAENLLD